MTSADTSDTDGLWSRIRAALTGRPPMAAASAAPPPRVRPGQLVEEALSAAWKYSAQRKVSLCVMALDIDCFAGYATAYGRAAVEDCVSTLEGAIGKLLPREVDRCLRSSTSGFLLVLPDMPLLMARDLAGRIALAVRREGLINKESHSGQVSLSIGLAVANPRGNPSRELVRTANEALKKAQRRGLARLEVVDLRTLDDARHAA